MIAAPASSSIRTVIAFTAPCVPTGMNIGVSIVLGAGFVNLLLGWYLIRTGRKYESLTLVADGRHVLSDFYTSAGIVIGLLLVRFTGLAWLDPVAAAVVARLGAPVGRRDGNPVH